jgi:hypothetical protein
MKLIVFAVLLVLAVAVSSETIEDRWATFKVCIVKSVVCLQEIVLK